MTASTPPAAPVLPVTLSDPWLRRLLSGIVAAMTGVVTIVAVLAFVASFGAIHQFASRSGGIAPGYAWMAPLFVDSFVFVGACGDLWTALTRIDPDEGLGWERLAAWAPKGLLVAAAAASYGLNIAHAPPTGPARTVAALPPTALVVTEIVLMVIARHAARYRALRLTGEHTAGAGGATRVGRRRPARDGTRSARGGPAARSRLAGARSPGHQRRLGPAAGHQTPARPPAARCPPRSCGCGLERGRQPRQTDERG